MFTKTIWSVPRIKAALIIRTNIRKRDCCYTWCEPLGVGQWRILTEYFRHVTLIWQKRSRSDAQPILYTSLLPPINSRYLRRLRDTGYSQCESTATLFWNVLPVRFIGISLRNAWARGVFKSYTVP